MTATSSPFTHTSICYNAYIRHMISTKMSEPLIQTCCAYHGNVYSYERNQK